MLWIQYFESEFWIFVHYFEESSKICTKHFFLCDKIVEHTKSLSKCDFKSLIIKQEVLAN